MRKSLFLVLALALALSVSAGCSDAGSSSYMDEAETEIQLTTEAEDTEADADADAEVVVQFSPLLQADHQGGTLRLGQIPSEEIWRKEEREYNDENEWIDMAILSCEKDSTSGYFAPETIIYYELINLYDHSIDIDFESILVNGVETGKKWSIYGVDGMSAIQDNEWLKNELNTGDTLVFRCSITDIDRDSDNWYEVLGRFELTFIIDEVGEPGSSAQAPAGWIATIEDISVKINHLEFREISWGDRQSELVFEFIISNPTEADVNFLNWEFYINGVSFDGEVSVFSQHLRAKSDSINRNTIGLYDISLNPGDIFTLRCEMRMAYDRANVTNEIVELNFTI